ncbi:upf0392 protein f13g3.3 [Plakobranchus ocellatus]|uniref:Upf0392 protein f13g3.3 n=1 Tax=Plakobranchus ocellatus TaxID=259542 RepID=A0AAV4DJD3_9GAST|nr:upf0392 protein f13g3.3 [Plakobranchus ocellatus]
MLYKREIRHVAKADGKSIETGQSAGQDWTQLDTLKRSRRYNSTLQRESSGQPGPYKERPNLSVLNMAQGEGHTKDFNDTRFEKDTGRSKAKAVVEVEEWDRKRFVRSQKQSRRQGELARAMQTRNSMPDSNLDPSVMSSLVNVQQNSHAKMENSLLFYNQTLKPQSSEYYLEFCDRVFDDARLIPNICNRPAVELTNKNHIPVNSVSLFFRRVGEVKVYSSYLDVRGEPTIRAMALAPAGQSNGPSIYWCVFHIAGQIAKQQLQREHIEVEDWKHPRRKNDTKFSSSDARNVDGNKEASVMSFYAASDGHGRANQFYILSCAVPKKALPLYAVPVRDAITVQIVVGSRETAFIAAVQDRIFLDVIVNKLIDLTSELPRIQTNQNVRKTLLVDINFPVESNVNRTKQNLNKSNLLTFENFHGLNDGVAESHRRNRTKRQLRKLLQVDNDDFGDDDDDEDKEISREKKNHAGVSKGAIGRPGRARVANVITIPHPYRQVGQVIASCVAPLHGPMSALQMVEFMELSLLLGVQHVVFYVPSSPSLEGPRTALRVYATRGLATVLPWDLPGTANGKPTSDDLWARGRDIALNDCLYRTMHRFDWALFLDLDEFFVPRVTPDLPSFLKYLQARHRFNASRTTDLVFPSAYFPPPTRASYKNLTTVPGFVPDVNKFISLKSVRRTYFDQQQTLRMIRPDAAVRVGAGERKRTSFFLSSRYASVHHYSHCPRNDIVINTAPKDAATNSSLVKVAVQICNHLKVDWTMWRFKTLLVEKARISARRLTGG